MTRDGHTPRFCWVLILPVAAFCDNQVPAVGLDKFDGITNSHNMNYSAIDPLYGFGPLKVLILLPKRANGLRYLRVGGRGFCLGAGKTRSEPALAG